MSILRCLTVLMLCLFLASVTTVFSAPLPSAYSR